MVIVHGGPGGRSGPRHRNLVDLTRWRVIQYDQRGCGNSTPRGQYSHNTFDDLVDDLERLRLHLRVRSWVVLGFSWGTTIALAWASRYGSSGHALILSGVYLGRRCDLAIGRPHPQVPFAAWKDVVANIAENERNRVAAAYLSRFRDRTHPDHRGAIRRWIALDGAVSGLPYAPDTIVVEPGMGESLSIEAHYVAHDFFLPVDGVIPLIKSIPTAMQIHVAQGLNDSACRESAIALNMARTIKLTWVLAGHSVLNPKLTSAVFDSTEYVRLTMDCL
ncbi:alpha/beta fold hydrolase [Mycobacterium montefiorense]|nr:alpha/beta fold hydrolase [Mycobacterium montefiorense]